MLRTKSTISQKLSNLVQNPALSCPRKGYADLPPLRNGLIFMNDTECAGQNEKPNKEFVIFIFQVIVKINLELVL